MSKRIKGFLIAGLLIVESAAATLYFRPAHAAKQLQCKICGPQQIQIVTCNNCPAYFTEPGDPNNPGGQLLCQSTGCHFYDPHTPVCDYYCSN